MGRAGVIGEGLHIEASHLGMQQVTSSNGPELGDGMCSTLLTPTTGLAAAFWTQVNFKGSPMSTAVQ